MKFDELDASMRVYETAHDHCVLPGIYMVARIDGRSFTRLTKESAGFDAPFDVRFRDLMVDTTRHLMNCGFKVVYGYTESDEISLLFDADIDVFGRKTRKYNSILAGEASAKFSLMLGALAAFDCRISELPSKRLVVDYFRWRNEDAHRNAMNAHCYWMLRKEGATPDSAAAAIAGKSLADKNELLFSRGINFNALPNWQKRGVGLYWGLEEKVGFNPKDNVAVVSQRRAIVTDMELPMRDAYSAFVGQFLNGA
ncbi:tRNA(His) guanylyltransferase Thg1 family protein [Pseudoduganella violaceinigra]|uniref:tRNA(His) guanylyltransferase Thg1 family protein n=1 Tax=Pseudoduganella violaceinigra TaxID=246602 RepID=UPI00042496B2|nr:tRNA(His) guanylyltransferase Thg1 family protein [Pseudoduganella violaceinigra]